MSWGFHPDAARSAALSAELNRRLMASLRYVFGEVGADLGIDDHRFEAWIAALEQVGRPDPRVHALFHSIVADMQAGALDRAVLAATKLLALGAASDQLTIHPLQCDVDDAWPVALFSRFADIEQSNRLDFTAPQPGVTPKLERLIDQGLNLIARHDPALDGELRALLSDILIVAQAPSRQFVTAAVSCFQNWGGLLFNPSAQRDELDIVETLAHEATHLTLFALALDEPLLTNDPAQRYYSPLRQAPRSMDGVYHATIVSARVTRALLRQAERQGADLSVERLALNRAATAARYFYEGLKVVEADAQLTPLGCQVLEDSKAFMADAQPHLIAAA